MYILLKEYLVSASSEQTIAASTFSRNGLPYSCPNDDKLNMSLKILSTSKIVNRIFETGCGISTFLNSVVRFNIPSLSTMRDLLKAQFSELLYR